MNTRYTHQDYLVHPAGQNALDRLQARRRQLLGILLIVVGTAWFCLRLTGVVGDWPWPIRLVEGTIAMIERLSAGAFALSVPQAACGMLAAYIIHSAR